jgi:S1-C subfamily serine protease
VVTRPMDEPDVAEADSEAADLLSSIGMTVANLDGEEAAALDVEIEDGVIITSVEEGGPAWRARLEPGQIITSVNRKSVSDRSSFYDELVEASERSRVLFLISDGRSSRFAVVVFE